ncbi:hypothetical protein FNV43_RR26515 [Rhamnella rubrinervis]|uniref:DUF1985 domain-containing protein n=1 Tax=Rhamnella rubrinervis TaxID=2594499 RepID=A0A8K0DPG3_9ROSA|nr:hypothetical protein FNV43_RR26515 [Rhamnella rubrinervis]
MKRVVPETPILLPVEKKRHGNVEEQAPISTTTNIAPEQPQPVRPAVLQVFAFYYNSHANLLVEPAILQVLKCIILLCFPAVVNHLVPDDKKYHAHLTSNSNLDRAIDVIKNKLSKGMDNLLASWIGKFFEIKTVHFCGGFIHHLLLHQVECEDKNVMEFEFNSTGARFDRKCFAIITGLNCGKFPRDSELEHLPYDLWTKFFGKCGLMTQGEFSKAFEDLDFDENEVANNVKCCMFYFLETVLLGGDKKRLVRNENFNIIQNDDLCSRYPWGNLSYDATISSLRSRIKLGREVTNYSIWGFETIPTVATIGPRGKYHGSSWIPRILVWSCPSILQYSKLTTSVFDRKDGLGNLIKNEQVSKDSDIAEDWRPAKMRVL